MDGLRGGGEKQNDAESIRVSALSINTDTAHALEGYSIFHVRGRKPKLE